MEGSEQGTGGGLLVRALSAPPRTGEGSSRARPRWGRPGTSREEVKPGGFPRQAEEHEGGGCFSDPRVLAYPHDGVIQPGHPSVLMDGQNLGYFSQLPTHGHASQASLSSCASSTHFTGEQTEAYGAENLGSLPPVPSPRRWSPVTLLCLAA